MKKIGISIILCVLLVPFVFAVNDLMALQGTVNTTLSGDIRVTIWNTQTGGAAIYDSGTDFDNTVQNGRYDILLGSGGAPLNLEYGRTYYLDMSINSQDLDFNGSERQQFQSSVGKITSAYINDSAISSLHILDGSISGIDIASDSIEKSKIELTGAWLQSEIPSLTGNWTGTLNASRIVSQLLLNVNNSQYLQGYAASIFFANDTSLSQRIDSVSSTAGIKNLGFNTTTELDNRFYLASNPNGYVSSFSENDPQVGITTAGQMCVGNGTGINCNVSIPSGTVDTNTNVTSIQVTGTNTKTLNLEQPGLPNLTATWTDIDTDTNSFTTAENTSIWSGINSKISAGTKLGNSSGEIQSVFYPVLSTYANNSLLSTYANQTWVSTQGYITDGNTNWDNSYGFTNESWVTSRGYVSSSLFSTYANSSLLSTYANQSWVTGQGYVSNGLLSTYANSSLLTTYVNNSLLSTYLNASDQKYNDTAQISNVNTTANIKNLGFNTTTELDSRYYSSSNPSGYISSYTEADPKFLADNSSILHLSDNTSLWLSISNLNRSGNMKALGFNLTSELDNRFVAIDTKLGNSTEEIQAANSPMLSTYANQSWVQEQGYVVGNPIITNWNSEQTNSTVTTPTKEISELTVTLEGSSTYLIYCKLLTRSTAVGIGERLNVSISGSPTLFGITWLKSVSATTITPFAGESTSQNLLANTGSGAANTTQGSTLNGYIKTSGTAATIKYGLYSETAANYVAVMPYSWCKYEKVA